MIFSAEVVKKLMHYIYLYLDPDTNEIFYIGRGKGNRVFSHLKDEKESEKASKIEEIRQRGKEPKVEILIHGLQTKELAKKVETTAIDIIGVHNLTNKIRGWQSGIYGRMDVDEIISLYSGKEAKILEPSILIRIRELFHYGMTPLELYDATRGMWKIGERRKQAEYAFSIFEGIIKEVYKIESWFPAGTTFTTRDKKTIKTENRWEFVGHIAPPEIRKKYINKSVRKYFKKRARNPIQYVNIE